jgi:tetratricopeptide (TPR) repeat protein
LLALGLLAFPCAGAEKPAAHDEKKEKPAKKEAAKPEAPEEKKKEAEPKHAAKEKEKEEPPRPPTPVSILNEVAAYARLARQAADQEKWPLTEHFLERMVDLPATDDEKKDALLEIAKTYELHENYPKAIAMYERINSLFSGDPDQPNRLLALGCLYRKIGANELAIARFYNVLNASLTLTNRRLESSRQLTQRAQAEIADTHFLLGDYPQARRYYELLSRLDLPHDERARVSFRLAHIAYLTGEIVQSGAATQQFLEDFPDDPAAPECRYLLALSLRALNRPKEAYEQILTLVREQDERKQRAPDKWLFWQKKAGNEFANDLYQRGEYLSALTIYQNLATLAETPDWQWPVIYQMGLCFEKLRIDRRAAEAYKFIIDEAKKPGRDLAQLPESVRNLVSMAQWRGEQLVWKNGAGARLDRVLGADPETQAVANRAIQFR